ncbi:MAG: endonuclease MutS2, partial [Epsilonproteobacteria bacterium]|nr:endonuclease MutS2 [Campylobacterota bacterium]NPA64488.1 endonuclease MutS2 [Campylobacterota bacterium]
YRFLNELAHYQYNTPPKVQDLSIQLMHLKKQGVLKLEEIYEFVKIVRYFLYLKSLKFEGRIKEWLDSIEIPDEIVQIEGYFDEEGNLISSVDERLEALEKALGHNKSHIRQRLQALINARKLQSYLVDRQIHYIAGEEALLVRGGFNHVLKATVVGRSSAGFFYVVPEELRKLKEKETEILSQIEEIHYQIQKRISATLTRWLKFLHFIDKAFDRFDHYQARLHFAKSGDLNIILPKSDNKIILKEFAHPALENPKPISLDFSKKILIITGVNAGGKTMLLKSILAAAYLAKYLIPMKAHPSSHIGRFKEIVPIIEDPQNVKNDISTFAGRMLEFSRLFSKNHLLVGVDEIELGTDSDEAATLFKVILEELLKKDIKIAITTHHKRLASLMAAYEEVELVAAMYDEEKGVPTYEFLQGIIGKSYAFETARRYGIPLFVVKRAKEEYGKDLEKLSELIERGSALERELKEKHKALDKELEEARRQRRLLEDERSRFFDELKAEKAKLQAIYDEALQEAKAALKAKEERVAHRHLTKAGQKVKEAKLRSQEPESLKVGDMVKYRKNRGVVTAIRGKEATIEVEGMKLRVPLSDLKRAGALPKKKQKSALKVSRPERLSVKLDLHGLRADEAIEKTDKFISDALIAGFDEVLIFHGVGTGKLARAVREYLRSHPKIKSFHDAPANMGGMGATVVEL